MRPAFAGSVEFHGISTKIRGSVLVAQIQSWLALLTRDVPQCDASTFANNPDVPEDILDYGNRLLEIFDEAADAKGQPLENSTQ